MRNTATSIEIASCPLRKQHTALCDNLEQVAKVAIGSRYVRQLIPHIPFSASVRLSENFPDGYTTTVSADELNAYLQGPEYGEMVRRQCIVSICAYMEAFVSALFPIVHLEERNGEKYGQFPNEFNLDIHNGNKLLRKIYYIYKHLKLALAFETSNWENVQCPRMLDEMVTLRHVIVHFGGHIKKPVHQERIGTTFKTSNSRVMLPPEAVDDVVHRVTINLRSLVQNIDAYISNHI